MDREQATQFVVRELGKHHSRNEIIVALCERMRINWREAEAFVREVESRHKRAIAAKQSPVVIFLSLGVLLAGLVLTVENLLYFISYFQTQHNAFSVLGALELRTLYFRAGSLLTGFAMILGGVIGGWRLFTDLFME